jgi:hypothetical protein
LNCNVVLSDETVNRLSINMSSVSPGGNIRSSQWTHRRLPEKWSAPKYVGGFMKPCT